VLTIAHLLSVNSCQLDVCGSVHHSTILTVKKSNKMQRCIKILLFLILNKT